MEPQVGPGWYGIRTIFRFSGVAESGAHIFEERVNVWKVESLDEAFRLAEQEAHEYVDILGSEDQPCAFLGLFQTYFIADDMGSGAEVFSMMRESDLDDEPYLALFFDTGAERHRHRD